MTIAPLTLKENYWETFQITNKDLDFIYNHLLDIETPQTSQELTRGLIEERIRLEKDALLNQTPASGKVYHPKDLYSAGDILTFPALEWQKGSVSDIRAGNNPELGQFQVICVKFENGITKEFASGLEEHILNQPIQINLEDPQLSIPSVYKLFGVQISEKLTRSLENNPDLVRIAGRWFPRALLVDVNIGHLNLAEAVLDMAGGGPLTAQEILDQVDLPTDVNRKLTEFSFNLALEEDGRFDEVGPAGEILWFLRRLEPAEVQSAPLQLKYIPSVNTNTYSKLISLSNNIVDELDPSEPAEEIEEVSISLIYPHWRAGTLPLPRQLSGLFPSAYESPRVQFSFIDGESGEKFSGWVVRSSHYVYGLQDWYKSQNLIPGSTIRIKRSEKPGEVIVYSGKHRPTREWIRTALIGSDGGIVFAMLKQNVFTPYDERMATFISDPEAIDQIWTNSGRQKQNLEQTLQYMMRELAKLNPQGHVHVEELYSAVNIVRRCPLSPILAILEDRPWVHHMGDLYFRLEDTTTDEV